MKKILLGIAVLGSFGILGYLGGLYFQKNPMMQKPAVPVKVALKWLHQAQFTGQYVALDKGYYRDSGLEVTLLPYDLKISPIDLVASGSASFGVVGADELLVARSRGIPVVAVAVIYQESPVVAFVLKSSPIQKVADFKGKRLGISPDKNVRMMMEDMLTRSGVNPKKDVTFVDIGFDYSGLKKGTIDVAAGYAINEPLAFAREGFPVRVFKPSSVGIKNYADTLFTLEKTIAEDPQLVSGFVSASLKGWETAFIEPEVSIDSVLTHMGVPLGDKSMQTQQREMLEASEPLINPPGTQTRGVMTYARWHRLYEEMKAAGIIVDTMDVSKAYTQEFVIR